MTAFFKKLLVSSFAFVLCVGCVAALNEEHYFATTTTPTSSNPSGIVNIFRLDVEAQGGFSNIRYVAGTYDERAVDFFLNEVKSADYDPSQGRVQGADKIFNLSCPKKDDAGTVIDECKQSYEEALKVIPLSATGAGEEFETFVVILSTNANAIAETIGAFAENDIAIQSINYLINKDDIEESRLVNAEKPLNEAEIEAVVGTLDALFDGYDSNGVQAVDAELAILRSIAIGLEPSKPISFNSIDEAEAWFSTIE